MKSLRLSLIACVLLVASNALAQFGSYLVIGTGSPDGIYLPVGSAVARIINASDVGTKATLFTTEGSGDNIQGLLFQDYGMAVVQADVAYKAANGMEAYASNPIGELRAIMGLHKEPLHLVCRRDAGVESLADLAGKRVNIGLDGSGQHSTVEAIFAAAGIELDSMQVMRETSRASADHLRDGNLDCFFYAVGIGSQTLQYAARSNDVSIVPLQGGIFDELVETTPYYTYTTIPAYSYAGQTEAITTFGTHALLVTTEDYHMGTIYRITKALLENRNALQESHPSLAILDDASYTHTDIPLHEGAARAFAELGMNRR